MITLFNGHNFLNGLLLPLVRVVTNDRCSDVLANKTQVEPLNINLMVDLHCIDPKVVEHQSSDLNFTTINHVDTTTPPQGTYHTTKPYHFSILLLTTVISSSVLTTS